MKKKPDFQRKAYRKPFIVCYEKLLHPKFYLEEAEDGARCSLCGGPLFDVLTVEKELRLKDVCINIYCESRRHETLWDRQEEGDKGGIITCLQDQNDPSKPT